MNAMESRQARIIERGSDSHYGGRVRANECDAGGVVYYANYSVYLHDAARDFLDGLGPAASGFTSHGLGWVGVEQSLHYRRPLRDSDEFRVYTTLLDVRGRRVRLEQRIENANTGELAVAGHTLLELAYRGSVGFAFTPEIKHVLSSGKLAFVG